MTLSTVEVIQYLVKLEANKYIRKCIWLNVHREHLMCFQVTYPQCVQ